MAACLWEGRIVRVQSLEVPSRERLIVSWRSLQESRDRRSSRPRRRPSSSPFDATLCCRSMTASMPCNPRSHTCALVTGSLSAASWHQPPAGCRRRQAGEEEVQDLSDRLLPITEVRTEQGKLHMFVAIDRTSKFAFVELHERASSSRRPAPAVRPCH